MPNPYLQDQANNIASNLTQNWQQNALPSINSGAQMAGGFGGSRQGIAQGISANGLNQAIGQAQTNLYSNAYNTDQQLAAQQAMQQAQLAAQERMNNANLGLGYTQAGNSYNLGLGQLGLGQQSADTAQYNAQTTRGLGYGQLQQQGDQNNFNNQLAGFNAQIGGLNSLMNWNNLGLGWANQQQQTPINNLTQLSNIGSSIGGQGGTTSTPYQGNPWLGALGGAQLGSNIFGRLFGG